MSNPNSRRSIPPVPQSARSVEKERRQRSIEGAAGAADYHLVEAFSCHHVLDLRRRMRVAVEAVFRHAYWKYEGDPEGKDLHNVTLTLEKRGVPARIIEMANHLRRFGNEAAHARDEQPLRLRMEDNEVEEALYRLRDLTIWYFETERDADVPNSITASIAFLDPKDVVAGRIDEDQRFRHDGRLFEMQQKYRLERVEGVGTTAIVYAAFDTLLERRRALKVQKLEFKQSESVLESIRREAKLLCDTRNPRLVPVSLIDRLPDGRFFFEMPYLEGGSVARRLAAGGLEKRTALAWAIDLLEALEHLHEQGVVHRDIKPENLLIDGHERVALADLGLARTLEGGDFIRTRTVSGTVRYLAPEVQFGGKVGPCSDVYSAGIVVCEMFGGTFEFGEIGDDLDSPLGELVRRMTAQDLRKRPSAVESLQVLRAWDGAQRRGSVRPGPTVSELPRTERDLLVAAPAPFRDISALSSAEELWSAAEEEPLAVRQRCDDLLATTDDSELHEARARALVRLAREDHESSRKRLAEVAAADATEALFFRPHARTYALRATAIELAGGERERVWHDRETAFLMSLRDAVMLEELVAAEAAAGSEATYVGMSLVALLLGGIPKTPVSTNSRVVARIEALRAYVAEDFARARAQLEGISSGDAYTALLRALVELGAMRTRKAPAGSAPPSGLVVPIRRLISTAMQTGPAWLEELASIISAVVTALESGSDFAAYPALSLLETLQHEELVRLFRPALDISLAVEAR